MSLLHCPLCVGLALLSLLRAGAHLVLLKRLLLWTPPLRTSAAH